MCVKESVSVSILLTGTHMDGQSRRILGVWSINDRLGRAILILKHRDFRPPLGVDFEKTKDTEYVLQTACGVALNTQLSVTHDDWHGSKLTKGVYGKFRCIGHVHTWNSDDERRPKPKVARTSSAT